MTSLLAKKSSIWGVLICLVALTACAPAGSFDPLEGTDDQTSQRDPADDGSGSPAPTEPVPPVPKPRPSNAPNISVCQGRAITPGIDVSAWNPNINWPRVKTAGKHFVFIKATEGIDYVSPQFAGDWAAAKQSGILRGAYHFFRPGLNPTTQAQLFIRTIGALGAEDLPALFDWEVTDNVSIATQIQRAQVWLDLVEKATGKTPIIYSGPSFWNVLKNPISFIRYPLFIANYQVSCPAIPAPWSAWTFWQHGADRVDGVPTPQTDVNMFNGSLDQLRQLARRKSVLVQTTGLPSWALPAPEDESSAEPLDPESDLPSEFE